MDDDIEDQFQAVDLDSPDEEVRCRAVMAISRLRLRDYEEPLLVMLSREESTRVKRHVVRALGNLGALSSLDHLVRIIREDQGLIVGDAAEALGKLQATEARERLRELTNSDVDWVANKARWALRQIPGP